jgi:hypothetical protein
MDDKVAGKPAITTCSSFTKAVSGHQCSKKDQHLISIKEEGRREFFCSSTHLVSYLVVMYGKQGKKAKAKATMTMEKEKEAEVNGGN